jgi:flagellar hook-basal body complex protein FliE
VSELRIDGIGPVRYTPLGRPLEGEAPQADFGQSLREAVRDVNALQLDAAQDVTRLVAGEPVDLHEVMISAEEATIAFDLMMEIRNKLLEAYQEIMRMHV